MGHGNGYDDYGTCGCGADCVCDANNLSECPSDRPYNGTIGTNAYSPVWDLRQYLDVTEDIDGNPITLPPCGWWRISAPHNTAEEIETELQPFLKTGQFDANGRFVDLPERIETDKVLYLDICYGRCTKSWNGNYVWASCGFPNHNYSTCEGLVNGTYSTEEFSGEGVVSPRGRWQLTHHVVKCGAGYYCFSGQPDSTYYTGYVSNTGELVGLPLLDEIPGETIILVLGDRSFADCTGGQINTAVRKHVLKEVYRINAMSSAAADPGGHVLDVSEFLGQGIGTPGRCWQIVLTSRCSSATSAILPGLDCSMHDGSYCSGKADVTLLNKTGEAVNTICPVWSGTILFSGKFAADGSMEGLEQGMELVIEPVTGYYTRRCDWYNDYDSCYQKSYYHLIAELLYEEWTVT